MTKYNYVLRVHLKTCVGVGEVNYRAIIAAVKPKALALRDWKTMDTVFD